MENKTHTCPLPSLKVSLVSRHFGNLGGLEKYGWRIAQAFTKRGAHVNIVTSDMIKKSEFHPLIRFHSLPVKKWLNFRKMEEFDRACTKWHEEGKFDIVFGMDRTRHQTHIRAGNGVHAAFLKHRENMGENYSSFKSALNPLNRTILNIEKHAFESPDLKILFTNSHMVKKEVLTYYQTPPEKIQVVHNGVEWKEMEKDFNNWLEKKQAVCNELGLDPSRYHFLFIGNGYKRKGLAPLLKALSILPFKDFHLSVLGKDKKAFDFIKLAEKLGLQDHVSFFGARSDIRKFYQYADSLVIPSFYDPFANVTVEALAMGLFVVTSKTNGGNEVLKPENGIVIENLLHPQAFAQALTTAIMHPKTWIRSQNIRNSVKHLDFSNQLSTLIDLTLESIHV
jgi:UDP-glucose:(heptosyl)LPS alpha-1,3-glucosyltransferase